jgi:hypothetical protein
VSGATATLTLALSGPAPSGGASVSANGGNSAALAVQSTYLVPAGQTSASDQRQL